VDNAPALPADSSAPPRTGRNASPERFVTARTTLYTDRFMTGFIRVGGGMVIVAVALIFVFIISEVIPLFASPKVTHGGSIALPSGEWLAVGSDAAGKQVFLVDRAGSLAVVTAKAVDPKAAKAAAPATPASTETRIPLGLADGQRASVARFDLKTRSLVVGGEAGRLAAWTVPDRIGSDTTLTPLFDTPIGAAGGAGKAIIAADFKDHGSAKLAAAIQDLGNGRRAVYAVVLKQKMVLGEVAGGLEAGDPIDLGAHLGKAQPERVLVGDSADSVIVVGVDGEVSYLAMDNDSLALRQRFTPFAGAGDGGLAMIDFLFGGVSLVCLSKQGANTVYSLYRHQDEQQRRFGAINRLDPLAGEGPAWFARSIRNKAYLIGRGNQVSLRFATTGAERWTTTLERPATMGTLNAKFDRAFLVDDRNQLHSFNLADHHPDAGLAAFFAPIWYEGYSKPQTEWQSSGATDDNEPKLSLIPLLVGTLKGTIYALLFAVPLALLAAIYTAEFMHPRFKLYVKPTMELMASLPSVVLGFIAALFLAPLIDTRVPAILVAIIVVPAAVAFTGWAFTRLPPAMRSRLRPGSEFIALLPVVALALYTAGWLGPVLEALICQVRDPATGKVVSADFRQWWPQFTGASYTQRNSLVVGFVMGFAVIPIIFTIAEDSLSGVPPALRSGSLALGASRWQTAIRVVVPTASAGIFSASMIGLGRAVGETMIVVMATGNTAVKDLNPFSGMRTLSATIAVELPEAPHHSTLYRTLFLCALVLFILTFVVNTGAELLRQWLRERYRTV